MSDANLDELVVIRHEETGGEATVTRRQAAAHALRGWVEVGPSALPDAGVTPPLQGMDPPDEAPTPEAQAAQDERREAATATVDTGTTGTKRKGR